MNNLRAIFWFEYIDVVFCTAGILHQSLAGAMLSKILHSLLLLPVGCVQCLLFHLLGILAPLDCLNRVLPEGVHCEQGRNSLPEGVQCEQESNSSSGKCLFCCTLWLFMWYESERHSYVLCEIIGSHSGILKFKSFGMLHIFNW